MGEWGGREREMKVRGTERGKEGGMERKKGKEGKERIRGGTGHAREIAVTQRNGRTFGSALAF